MLVLPPRLLALALVATISACVTPASPPPIAARPVQLADGSTVQPGAQSGLDGRSVELARVQIDIPRGTEIGRLQGQFGNKCRGVRLGPIHQEQPRTPARSNEWNDTFYRVMSGHGFRVAGNPNQLFDTAQQEEGDLQFGLTISEMKLEMRAVCDFFSENAVGMRGNAKVAMEWQVFDPVRRQVILKQRGEGGFEATETVALDPLVILQLAFADAANQLAVSPELRRMMTERAPLPQPGARPAAEDRARIPLRRVALSQQPINSHIDRLRSATVLIDTGDSHGSGFIVSEDGLMITNKHVVGGQRFVRVVLVSGRTVVGEVLRQHELRDVALVKLEGSGYPAMTIRETPVTVTEEVYVIGAPRFKQLAWTVTRGVVSAWRPARLPGQPFDLIQADVAVHGGNSGGPMLDRHGNLVGITVAGYAMGENKSNASLNLFIPILDGLEKLGVDLVDPAEFQRRRNLAASQ
ncbi:trypsin-like peptidase domain-containing protein [Ferrovibrio terrae]|uniref:Trypsin-like peptidase domain-containing protein n=1 Tax=Ferrovibrio terrae TaxID=2594003 RepID=A0A516H2B5_9PROT|nr:serine protease [Ferrovibrio terrae]QDO97918.1 trypsin-like peptidase domain-containing protein [Ferrovibrio terrae]